jgi:hypothetical protein
MLACGRQNLLIALKSASEFVDWSHALNQI